MAIQHCLHSHPASTNSNIKEVYFTIAWSKKCKNLHLFSKGETYLKLLYIKAFCSGVHLLTNKEAFIKERSPSTNECMHYS